MNPLASLILLLVPCLCQSVSSPWATEATTVAFIPRGGGAIGGRRTGHAKKTAVEEVASPLSDFEGNATDVNESEDDDAAPFDLQEVSKQLHREEIEEIKASQQFLQKQQRRRELDTTWLDKGITSFIEFFENLFRWEVIEV
ncbi:hypothetical protein ACHAXR_000391 [Thalassiosira sp. AJA248-18]